MRKTILLLMCAVLSISQLAAQTRKITGKVTNAAGSPVPNASILIRGTSAGTTSDETGSFTITVPSKTKSLVISSVNYSTTEVNITGDNMVVALQPANGANLSEVVVVAYGSVKKTNLTGSVGTVKGTELENKPFSSVDKALQGSVAGLQISSTSGAPGSATDIRIRGIGSINASASPLWVIDGAIANTLDLTVNTTTANPLSSINPDDIESISVLKDAAATAVYGSQAANGVILVTTKKGRGGKTRLNLSTEIGKNSIAFKNKNNRSLTTPESQGLLRESLINAGYAADNTEADALIIDPTNGLGFDPDWLSTNTNWYDVVTRKGNQQQYNLSLSGGNEKTTFYASGGYFKQDGTTIATDFKRYNGSVSVTHKPTDWLNFTMGLNGATSTQNTPGNGGAFANPVLASYFLVPWYSPYNTDGSLKYGDAGNQFPIGGGVFNPLVQAAYNKNTARQTTLRGYVSGEVKILTDLKFTSRYSAEYFDVSEDQYRNPFYGDGQANGGDAFSAYTRRFDYTFSNYFDYRKGLNAKQDIYFDIKAGYEASAIKNYTLQAGGQAFPTTLALQYLASAATPTTAYTVPSDRANTSLFSVADVNYKDRYVVSGSFRRDGSSVFGANNRYGNFYSVGGTWNVSEEAFMHTINWLNLLKLRGSYGVTGNSIISGNGLNYYTSLATYGYGYNYTGLPGSAPNNVGNPDLSWEKNKQFDIGFDFGFFKSRLYGSFDYYDRKSSAFLANIPLSPTSGFASGQLQNIGSLSNKGIEVSVGGKPIVTTNFTWDVNFNIAHNNNKVISLYNHSPVPASQFRYTEGNNLQAYYLRPWAGVDPANGDPLWYTDGTHKTTTNDYSKTQLVLDNTRTAAPKYYGAFTNTFTYKGISLSAQLNYNFGNYVYDSWGTYMSSEGTYLGTFGQLSQELNSWKKPGDNARVPQIVYGGNKNSYRSSTRFLYKGDYIRLRDLQLGYTIPQKITRKAYINNLNIYVRGTNLFTFATDKYIPFDPEAGINSTTNLDVFPLKNITVGIKIGL